MEKIKLILMHSFLFLLVMFNVEAITITQYKAADLTIQDLKIEEPYPIYNMDTDYAVSFDIMNNGGGTINSNFKIGIYVDDQFIKNAFYKGEIITEDMTVKEADELEQRLTSSIIQSSKEPLTLEISSGEHILKVVAKNTVEANHEDNEVSIKFKVEDSCVDPDGRNIFIKGSVTVKEPNTDIFNEYPDEYSNNELKEYACDSENRKLEIMTAPCYYGYEEGACLPFAERNEINSTGENGFIKDFIECGGCFLNHDVCLSPGTRITKYGQYYYCDGTKMELQKALNEPCSSNFECTTNLCRMNNYCDEYILFEKVVNWIVGIFS